MSVPDIIVHKIMALLIGMVLVFSSCDSPPKEVAEGEMAAKQVVIESFQESDFRNEADRRNYLQVVKQYMDSNYAVNFANDHPPHWLYLQLETLQRFQIEYITYD